MDEIWKSVVSYLFEGGRWPLLGLIASTYVAFTFTEKFFYPDSATRQFRDAFLSPFFWGVESLITLGWTVAYVAIAHETLSLRLVQGGLFVAALAEAGVTVARLPQGRAREQMSHL